MKSYLTTAIASFFILSCLLSAPVAIHAQTDANKSIDIPLGGSADFPVGVEGAIDELSGQSEFFNVTEGEEQSLSSPGIEGDPEIPVDGGLGFLLAAGLGYGANRLRKHRQEKRSAEF